MKFSKRLKEMRKEKKYSQEELGKLLSLDKSTISLYESGKRQPGYETLSRLADFFDCSIDYLLGRTSDTSDPDNQIQSTSPDLDSPLRQKTRSEALQKIAELDTQLDLPDEVLLGLIRKVKEKFGELPEEEYNSHPEGPATTKEQQNGYRPDLEKLVPRNEINLAEAMLKISEIKYVHKLNSDEANYLMHRAVDHYGKPEFPEDVNEAAHGPKVPGQLERDEKKGR